MITEEQKESVEKYMKHFQEKVSEDYNFKRCDETGYYYISDQEDGEIDRRALEDLLSLAEDEPEEFDICEDDFDNKEDFEKTKNELIDFINSKYDYL